MNAYVNDRRTACILIAAGVGDHVAARSLIGRSLRAALGVRKWRTDPHFVVYYPNGFDGEADFAARYTVQMTDSEYLAWEQTILKMAQDEGWNRPPTDAYHD